MKKKILAIFSTALLLALCAVPCFAYPSQNLTFGGFYQNDNVTPYERIEYRSALGTELAIVYRSSDLSRETSGFILEVELPFMNGYLGNIQLFLEENYSSSYVVTNTISTYSWSDQTSVCYFVVPRRGLDHLVLGVALESGYSFAPEDESIVCTLYPISLDTSEIEETAYNSGYQGGYNDGRVQGQGDAEDLDGFLVDIFAALAEFFTPLASLEIWGISAMGVLSLIVVASIAVIIFKMK